MITERNWNADGAGNGAVAYEDPSEPTDGDVILAMNTYGAGNFIRNLGQTMLAADAVNLAKLKTCFPDYWEHYKSYARCKKKGFPS